MKFGRNLPQHQVPEWAAHYVDYKDLKKLVSRAASEARERERDTADLGEFLVLFDRNLETVDGFYGTRFAAARRRLSGLKDRFGGTREIRQADMRELLWALLKMRGDLENLLWFGEVNRKALVRITRSSALKIPAMAAIFDALEARVDDRSFAKGAYAAQLLVELNEWLAGLRAASRVGEGGDEEAGREGEAGESEGVEEGGREGEAREREGKEGDDKDKAGEEEGMRHQQQQQARGKNARDAVRADAADSLRAALDQSGVVNLDDAALLRGLLQQAVSARAKACTAHLLGRVGTLDEMEEINRRNCLHLLVLQLARTSVQLSAADRREKNKEKGGKEEEEADVEQKVEEGVEEEVKGENEEEVKGKDEKNDEADPDRPALLEAEATDGITFLRFVLEALSPEQQPGLVGKDVFGRMPLHYAVRFGLRDAAEALVARMEEWRLIDPGAGIDGPKWQDEEGYAPLHLAVVSDQPSIAQVLLNGGGVGGGGNSDVAKVRQLPFASGDVLILAVKLDSAQIVRLLLRAGIDPDWRDGNGETALLVASRLGHADCAEALLRLGGSPAASLGATDKVFGRSPLHVAAVHGHVDVVRHLLAAGADPHGRDGVDWTAKEHAGFRGHLHMASLLADAEARTASKSGGEGGETREPELESGPEPVGAATAPPGKPLDTLPSLARRRPFCHLTDKSAVMISLGSLIPSKRVRAVELDTLPLTGRSISGFATALSLEITARDGDRDIPVADGGDGVFDLPLIEDVATRPALFYTAHPDQVTVCFDVVPTAASTAATAAAAAGDGGRIGRAVATLAWLLPAVGPDRASLHREVTVPILAAGSSMEPIGSVTFAFQVITPFAHPSMPPGPSYWGTPAQVIGHRGLGMNRLASRRLQIGENTIASFQAADRLGAHYIEFDVQVTKDGFPVIYHDSIVSESGTDATVWGMTARQFHHLSFLHSHHHHVHNPHPAAARPRSRSLGHADNDDYSAAARAAARRMEHGRLVSSRGFQPNTRGDHFIQAPFLTLEEVLRHMPPHVGLDIEIKYPSLREAYEHELDAFGTEPNRLCDTVLRTVFDAMAAEDRTRSGGGRRRPIFFSSFSPAICQHLRFKQSAIPVLFLSDGDASLQGPLDVRSSSLQEAIVFAKRWGMTGIVSAAGPLVTSPRLIGVVRDRGLTLLSYGKENSDMGLVMKQIEGGVDGVITDELVATVRALGLRK